MKSTTTTTNKTQQRAKDIDGEPHDDDQDDEKQETKTVTSGGKPSRPCGGGGAKGEDKDTQLTQTRKQQRQHHRQQDVKSSNDDISPSSNRQRIMIDTDEEDDAAKINDLEGEVNIDHDNYDVVDYNDDDEALSAYTGPADVAPGAEWIRGIGGEFTSTRTRQRQSQREQEEGSGDDTPVDEGQEDQGASDGMNDIPQQPRHMLSITTAGSEITNAIPIEDAYGVDELEQLKQQNEQLQKERDELLLSKKQKQQKHDSDDGHEDDTTTVQEAKILSPDELHGGISKWWKPLAGISFALAIIATSINIVLVMSSRNANFTNDAASFPTSGDADTEFIYGNGGIGGSASTGGGGPFSNDTFPPMSNRTDIPTISFPGMNNGTISEITDITNATEASTYPPTTNITMEDDDLDEADTDGEDMMDDSIDDMMDPIDDSDMESGDGGGFIEDAESSRVDGDTTTDDNDMESGDGGGFIGEAGSNRIGSDTTTSKMEIPVIVGITITVLFWFLFFILLYLWKKQQSSATVVGGASGSATAQKSGARSTTSKQRAVQKIKGADVC